MIHIKPSKNRQHYFVIKARNGKVLATSETYKSLRSVYRAIAALRKAAADVRIYSIR